MQKKGINLENKQTDSSLPKEIYLSKMVDMFPGYPFRSAIANENDGNTFVIQLKHVTSNNSLNFAPKESELLKTSLKGRKDPDYLQEGDILFTAKDVSNFATSIQSVPLNTVCAPHFFHLRLNKYGQSKVLPEFLTWQINSSKAQKYFLRIAQGSVSSAKSVSKETLSKLKISVPPLVEQKKFVSLLKAQQKQKQVYMKMIENGDQMLNAAGQKLIRAHK